MKLDRPIMPESAYDKGFIDGLRAYAFQKEGTFFVGTTGTHLRAAIIDRQMCWNYFPPTAEETKLEVEE